MTYNHINPHFLKPPVNPLLAVDTANLLRLRREHLEAITFGSDRREFVLKIQKTAIEKIDAVLADRGVEVAA